MRVQDFDFDMEEVLKVALESMNGSWETEFCESIAEKFEQYGTSMFLSSKQAGILCRIAGVPFTAPDEEPSHQQRQKQSRPPPRATTPQTPGVTPEMLKRLLHLCHPDKHGNSAMANSITQELLKMRK